MTRTAYAQLVGQKFFPPKVFGQWKEVEGTPEWRWRDVGMKIVWFKFIIVDGMKSNVMFRLWALKYFIRKAKVGKKVKMSLLKASNPQFVFCVFTCSRRLRVGARTRLKPIKRHCAAIQNIKSTSRTWCPLITSKAN
jgi:hypothetical protein